MVHGIVSVNHGETPSSEVQACGTPWRPAPGLSGAGFESGRPSTTRLAWAPWALANTLALASRTASS